MIIERVQGLGSAHDISRNRTLARGKLENDITQITVLRDLELVVATVLGLTLVLGAQLDFGKGAWCDVVRDVVRKRLRLALGSRKGTHERRLNLRVDHHVHFSIFRVPRK